MTLELAVALGLIGAVGALLSGMLGIGGAIVNYPMLLYIPAWLGVAHFTPHQVSGIVAVQVFVSTLSGLLALRKERMVHRGLLVYMGTAILIGSFAGSYGAQFIPGAAVNMVYAVLATLAAIMMMLPKRSVAEGGDSRGPFNRTIAVISAMAVGMASGIVGAGGAFILIPIMLLVLKVPIRVTIATSMAITFVSSVGTTIGKLWVGHVPFWPTLVVVIASMVAAPVGARLSRRMQPKFLRLLLALLMVATALKIWIDILG
ncbi:UPF0721 transmembrane protein [Alicyclobacillus cellulosilyticus]|uniref:Probable membrane transporter protein n=1 Tax=Alicyclobacillus cellulosilyticus TaxID=1003997 RepID=A0A917NLV9_9BACL|nr:sulfite exporter TauE/SafE family protein [Alicyclobacillus cellulosilyticus]GGJ10518.1 UPF0721 transmembrane protein [Alicyclobacillus cellulosilyticus]